MTINPHMDTKRPKAEQERIHTLWVTLPNYARIVYGFTPQPWTRDAWSGYSYDGKTFYTNQ